MQTTIQYIKKELTAYYPETEVQGFIRILIESVCGWNYTQQVLNKNERISVPQFDQIESAVLRLKKYEPIQYIIGETEFMGLNLKVNSAVLIPRPETEELVDWILRNNKNKQFRIIDIGTGSGCIPLALKTSMKSSQLFAVDISESALKVAKQNADLNNLEIQFFQADILKWENYSWDSFDIIVSNPPYVRELEKKEMHKNVLSFEPENALFVSNEDPLLFYRQIAEFALEYLVDRGQLYFEINENLGDEMCNLLEHKGFVDLEVKKDIHGKNRMLFCRKKNA